MTRLITALLLGAAVSTQAQAATLATPIQPSVDTVQQRLSLRTLMSCVAKSRPNWAGQLLAQPYLGEEPTTVRQNFIRIAGSWSFIKKDGAVRMDQRGKCGRCATATNWAVESRYWCGC